MESEDLTQSVPEKANHLEAIAIRRQRFGLLVTFLGALFFVAVVRMFFLATADLTDGIAEGAEGASWEYNVIPALRGRILDATGTPLAWSERTFDLAYERPEDPNSIAPDLYALKEVVSIDIEPLLLKVNRSNQKQIVIKKSLSPAEIERLDSKLRPTTGVFRVQQEFVRHTVSANPTVKKLIGETWQNGRKQVGTSGFEKKFNIELTGTDGYYRVLVDKDGNWVPGTWEQLRKPQEGFDKYVGLNLSSIPQ